MTIRPDFAASHRRRAGRAHRRFRHRADPPGRAAGAQRDRHLFRRHGDRSVSLLRGPEESGSRRVDEGARRTTPQRAGENSRPRRVAEGDHRCAATRCRRASPACRSSDPRSITRSACATENIFKLYVRDGFGGKERLLVDPDAVKSAMASITRIDYFAPSPDNKLSGLRHFRRRAPRRACSTSSTSRPARSWPTDRPRAISGTLVAAGRPTRLQPPAEAGRRRAGHRQISDTSASTSTSWATTRTTTRSVRRRRLAAVKLDTGGNHLRRSTLSARPTSSRSRSTACSAKSDLGRAAVRVERRQDAVGQGRRQRRRGHRRRGQGDDAVT